MCVCVCVVVDTLTTVQRGSVGTTFSKECPAQVARSGTDTQTTVQLLRTSIALSDWQICSAMRKEGACQFTSKSLQLKMHTSLTSSTCDGNYFVIQPSKPYPTCSSI